MDIQKSINNSKKPLVLLTLLFLLFPYVTAQVSPEEDLEEYSLGVIGTAFVVISQFYSLRKREVAIHKGSIKTWLKLHTYFGLVGPFLVLLHAGFPLEFEYAELFEDGTAGLSTYLMIIVVASGFIGRYLYRLMDERSKKLFKYWRDLHIPLVGVLFFSIAIHVTKTLTED